VLALIGTAAVAASRSGLRPLAGLAASTIEFKADYLTRRTPSATVKSVRIAWRGTAL
jgi:hypothetical protein